MEEKIIICPNEYKIKLLKETNNKLHNYKFMTKE